MSVVVTPKVEVPKTSAVAPADASLAVAPETPAVVAPLPAKDELSPKYAALARQQKLLRQQQIELKKQQEELNAKQIEYATKYVPRDKLKADPYGVLTEEGIPYDQIVNGALSQDPNVQMIKKLEARLEAIEAKRVQDLEAQQKQVNENYEKTLKTISNNVKLLVDSNSEYELIKANDASEAVVEYIKAEYERTGLAPEIEDAANEVERYLLEETMKLVELEKIKKKLNPVVEAAPAVETPAPKPQAAVKTITNARTVSPTKPMSERERRERAILAYKGQLSSQ